MLPKKQLTCEPHEMTSVCDTAKGGDGFRLSYCPKYFDVPKIQCVSKPTVPMGIFLLFTGLWYRVIIRGGDAKWRCNADSHLALNLRMISILCCIFKIVAFSCKSIIYIGSKGGPVAPWVKRWSADLVVRFDSRLRGNAFKTKGVPMHTALNRPVMTESFGKDKKAQIIHPYFK